MFMQHLCEPEACLLCGKEFKGKGSMKQHLQTHAGKVFTCNICQKMFKSKSYLKKHISAMHGENREDSIFCEICGKVLKWKSSRARHMATHLKKKS